MNIDWVTVVLVVQFLLGQDFFNFTIKQKYNDTLQGFFSTINSEMITSETYQSIKLNMWKSWKNLIQYTILYSKKKFKKGQKAIRGLNSFLKNIKKYYSHIKYTVQVLNQ